MVGEIERVAVDQVHREARQCLGNRLTMPPLGLGARVPGDLRRNRPGRHQGPGCLRAEIGDDDRMMAGLDQRAVERRQHLLGAADRVRADRGQAVADAEHGQRHRG